MRPILTATAAPALLTLSACGTTTSDRALSGAGIGAAAGAVGGRLGWRSSRWRSDRRSGWGWGRCAHQPESDRSRKADLEVTSKWGGAPFTTGRIPSTRSEEYGSLRNALGSRRKETSGESKPNGRDCGSGARGSASRLCLPLLERSFGSDFQHLDRALYQSNDVVSARRNWHRPGRRASGHFRKAALGPRPTRPKVPRNVNAT
jgi:hypothetical protein